MSLLSEAMTEWTPKTLTEVNDGMGGRVTTWVDGTPFSAAVVKDSSTETRLAEQAGAKGRYTVTTEKSINLQFHDVIVRASDGLTLRILSKGTDKCTPASAGLNMRQVSAEEWSIPS